MTRLLNLLAALPLLLLAAGAPDTGGIGFSQKLGAVLDGGLPFTGSDGRVTTLAAIENGHPTVLMLGYFACPALCGVVRDDALQALAGSGLSLPRDYSLLFLSIDASERTADADAAKRADMARHPTPGAAAGWCYVVAVPSVIARVEQAVGYGSRYDGQLKQFLHPAGLVVLTPAGAVSGYLLGVGYQPGALREALRQARSGAIGQQAPSILLLCFHYDPSTGRYSLAILKVLRLMGVLTLLGIGGLLILLHRHRRQRPV